MAGLAEHLKNLVTCPVCKETFTNPCQLPCGHNFCWNCVMQYACVNNDNPHSPRQRIQKKTIPCPECRQETDLDKIRKDFKVDELVTVYTTLQKEVPPGERCELCEVNQAIYLCHKCSKVTCDICGKVHLKYTDCQAEDSEKITTLADKCSQQINFKVNLCDVKLAEIQAEYNKAVKQTKSRATTSIASIQKYLDDVKQYCQEEEENVQAAMEDHINTIKEEYERNLSQITKIKTEMTLVNKQATELTIIRTFDLEKAKIDQKLATMAATTFKSLLLTPTNENFDKEKAVKIQGIPSTVRNRIFQKKKPNQQLHSSPYYSHQPRMEVGRFIEPQRTVTLREMEILDESYTELQNTLDESYFTPIITEPQPTITLREMEDERSFYQKNSTHL